MWLAPAQPTHQPKIVSAPFRQYPHLRKCAPAENPCVRQCHVVELELSCSGSAGTVIFFAARRPGIAPMFPLSHTDLTKQQVEDRLLDAVRVTQLAWRAAPHDQRGLAYARFENAWLVYQAFLADEWPSKWARPDDDALQGRRVQPADKYGACRSFT